MYWILIHDLILTVCDNVLHLLPDSEGQVAQVFGHVYQRSWDQLWIRQSGLGSGRTFWSQSCCGVGFTTTEKRETGGRSLTFSLCPCSSVEIQKMKLDTHKHTQPAIPYELREISPDLQEWDVFSSQLLLYGSDCVWKCWYLSVQPLNLLLHHLTLLFLLLPQCSYPGLLFLL